MNKQHLVNRAVHYALMTGAAVTLASYAASAVAANANSPAKLGKVTVTGTRIKRTDVETAQPITRISRQQIQNSGFTNVGQLIGRLTSSGGFANATGAYSGGRTQVDLRGLGSQRNLVLVNGKRWIQAVGNNTTNLNTIPTSIIDHVEILQDGASAVYGSDAISGVVNIITTKNFNGAEAHAYYGIHNGDGHWDGQTKQYDFTVGSGNDRGNVVFNATYKENNPIFRGNRKYIRHPIAGEPDGIGGAAGTPKGRFELFGPALSGRTFGQATCGTYDAASPTNTLCDLTLQDAPMAQPTARNFRSFQPTDAYNDVKQGYLRVPAKDVTTYVQGHYDLFDNVTFTANAAYIREESKLHRSSDPVRIGANSGKLANGKHIGIAATNPYNPFGLGLVADTSNPCIAAGSCIGLGTLTRRTVEAGPRTRDYNTDYFHIFAGFKGYVNLFNREVDWDVGFAQNRAQNTILSGGLFNNVNIAKALGPASQCTSPCVPLNFFGGSIYGDGGSITPAQVNYISFEPHDVTQSNLRDWTTDISSDLYDLPAGPLGVAIGWERVDNYGYNHPDSVKVAGNDSDGNPKALNGRVARDAEYAELNIPLLANRPGVKSLSVDIANRWTQFKQEGGLTGQQVRTSFLHNSSGRLNIRYQPITDLLLRASWSQGFRSPNVGDLFSGTSNTYGQHTDPCAPPPFGGYTGGALPPNCPNGTPDEQPNNIIRGRAGSNVNLKPESSLSRTVGFVYSPSQLPGLDVNADYFKIELTNTIGSVGFGNIVNGCFYDSTFCDLVTTSGNQIVTVRNITTNVGSLLTEGIDAGLHYKFPSTPIGDFDARINGTFVTKFDQTNVNLSTKTGFATSHLAGVDGHPKQRFNGYLDWDYGNWSAQYRVEYIDDTVGGCGIAIQGYCTYPNRSTDFQGTPGQFSLGRDHTGAVVYHDVHVAYAVPSINTTFGLGVNNLFDKTPPINGGGGYDLGFYRLPSRLVYGDIRVRF